MKEDEIVFDPNLMKALVVGGVTYRSIYDHQVTNEDLEKARLELGEKKANIKISLQELKEKLSGDKDFNYRSDDKYLLRFLRHRKYNVENAYRMIRKGYILRRERPDLFDMSLNYESLLKCNVIACPLYRHQDGNIIFWIDTNKWNLEESTFYDLLTAGYAISDTITMNPSCQIDGIIGLWDVGGLTARHLARYAYPGPVKVFAKSLQENFPWRFKQVFIINCGPVMRGVLQAFRYLISKKVSERLIILGYDLSELRRHVNPCILPKVYGGSLENSECSVAQHVLNNIAYLKYDRSFGSTCNSSLSYVKNIQGK